MSNPGFKIGLALGGGGARGLAHLGILQVLQEYGISVDVITGTSFGALAGSVFAIEGDATESIDIVTSILSSNEFKKIGLTSFKKRKRPSTLFTRRLTQNAVNWYLSRKMGFLKEKQLEKILFKYYKNKTFSDCKIPLGIISGNITEFRGVCFTEGSLLKAVQASTSLPKWMEPVHIGNDLYVDGYARDVVPVLDCRRLGADFVIAVNISLRKPPDYIKNALDVHQIAASMASVRSTDISCSLADYVIRPETDGFTWMDFDEPFKIIELGRQAALETIDDLLRITSVTT